MGKHSQYTGQEGREGEGRGGKRGERNMEIPGLELTTCL